MLCRTHSRPSNAVDGRQRDHHGSKSPATDRGTIQDAEGVVGMQRLDQIRESSSSSLGREAKARIQQQARKGVARMANGEIKGIVYKASHVHPLS